MLQRRRGGIEPLRVSTPRELKSRPSTSPSHPGFRKTKSGIKHCSKGCSKKGIQREGKVEQL